jgi:hypothetical protein
LLQNISGFAGTTACNTSDLQDQRPLSEVRKPIVATFDANFGNQRSASKYKGLVRLAPSGIIIPAEPK